MSTSSTYKSKSGKNLQYMDYYEPTDEELENQASSKAEQAYRDEYNRLFNSTKSRRDMMLNAIKDAETDYNESTDELNRHFEKSSQMLSDEALSRGLGRSSYALDLQMDNQNEKQLSLQKMLDYKVSSVNQIQNQIDSLEREFLDNQNYLSRKKADDIQSMLTGLMEQRDEMIRDVLEYNNKLTMKQREFNLKKIKANRDYQIKVARLNSSSSRSKSTSSSSSNDSPNILTEWNKLTGAGKLKFYNENYETIKDIDFDMYKNIVREITEYIKRGVKPAKDKSENYYK